MSTGPELLRGHLDALLLGVLADRPAHGYAVIERLRERSAGAFDLAEGTVYPALHRLERDGLLSSRWSSEPGRPRRVYSVTRRGVSALSAHRGTWRSFAQAVDRVLGESVLSEAGR
ncbi:MAG: helix-turn-helix transcriptional regulator [Candidatus Dormibacteraeota bacterium]|nr:helix-turn-helix transcriptional regulator [Candidatus Dormibacteraeota bacterium]